ncbi:MAG TPA: DUF58 domain-containing protein [Thermoanaerobaculia bacterium]|nr:DUF58 domain-containing protein [Thermoanaerobaculia bacterium]
MIRPGPRLLRGLSGLALAALFLPFVPGLLPVLGLGLLLLLGLAAREAVLLRGAVPVAERPERVVLSLGEEERVPLGLRSGCRRPVSLALRQLWPDLLDRPASAGRGRLQPGEILAFDLPVRAVRRGSAPLPPPWVALGLLGWAGGWVERVVAAVPGGKTGGGTELAVLPSLRAVARMRARLDRAFLVGLGSRASPRLGKGRDFERLREYVLGDDFRDLAWKASARHGKLITREYRLDRSQDILVAVDCGHRMAARVAHLTRLDHAVNAAVLLASVAHRMEDRVGVLAFADGVERGVGQGRGASHMAAITAFAARVAGGERHTDYLALAAHLRRRSRSRMLILLLTVLPELDSERTLARAVGLLVPQHLPFVVVLSDPDLEATAVDLLPADKPELCRTLVASDLWLERRRTIAELRRRGALVVEAPPGDAGIEAVNGYLEVKRRQLL